MKPSHIDQVVEIEKVSFHVPWSKNAFQSELYLNSRAYYIVALDGAKVVGYGGYWKIIDEAHITNIAVHPDHRRTGIAGQVLERLIAMAHEDEIKRMTLEVRVSNAAAIRLYEKAGFVSVGTRKKYYSDNNEDAYIMWKNDI
jgi:ribosomal-protein-alanine N-acetyltransferase